MMGKVGITRIDQETMHSPLLKLREKYPTPGPFEDKEWDNINKVSQVWAENTRRACYSNT